MSWVDFLGTFVEASIILPMGMMLYRKKYLSSELMILASYIVVTFLKNITGVTADILYYLGMLSFNNLIFYNLHNVIGTFIIFLIYFKLLRNKKWKLLCLLLTLVFSFFVVLDFNYGTLDLDTVRFNKYSYSTSNLFIIVIVLSYFYESLQDLKIEDITRFPYFWMSTGMLFYSGGTLLMYIFLIGAEKNTAKVSWNIHVFLSFLFNIAIILTFWYSKYLNKSNVK
ncbi:MAG: hypothetical protein MUF45_13375 [Spirosomaceae bacterium]|jgi:hypothetical protein|nr:hypothetical protein [Spirosomataceae bacterium]